MKAQFFLTRSGILAANKESIVFLTNSGEFVRSCSVDEFDHLTKEVGLVEITRASGSSFPLFEIPKPIKWHFLATIEVVCDESNFRAETSCYGGDYRYTTYHDWFCRNRNGKWEFAYIQWGDTSAEFSYDNISQQFQNDLVSLILEDVEVEAPYYRVWGRGDDQYQVVEKLATMASFEAMMEEKFEYIPRDGKAYTQSALTEERALEILGRLVDLEWEPVPEKVRNGGSAGMSKGRRK